MDNTLLKTTINLNISIQSQSQKVWLNLSYEKSKLDENWETHPVMIITIIIKTNKQKKNTFVCLGRHSIFFVFLFLQPGIAIGNLISVLPAQPIGKIAFHLLDQPSGKNYFSFTSPSLWKNHPSSAGRVQTSGQARNRADH